MSHAHHHHPHHACGHGHGLADATSRALAVGIGLNLAFVAIETGFGLYANSLSLLADGPEHTPPAQEAPEQAPRRVEPLPERETPAAPAGSGRGL